MSEPGPTEAPEGGANPNPLPPGRRRDPRFRAELIERLPQLGYSSWSVKEDFQVDQEWGGIVSLQSDAVLGPLEALVPGRRD
jgi:hypothetical protein